MSELTKLTIETEEFKFWSDVEIQLAIDSFSTISFTAPFEAEHTEFRNTFRPFTYKPITVVVNDQLLFTGTMMNVPPVVEPSSRSVSVSAYAAPAVMEDCTVPASKLPFEFNKQRLRDIATSLASHFGLAVEMRGEDGAIFDRVALEPEEKPAQFLAKLAQQRNFVMTDNASGALLFQKSIQVGSPVVRLKEGLSPLMKVTPNFNPQEYFSEITGFAPTKGGRLGSKFTVLNPFLNQTGVTVPTIRPHSFKLDDTDDADVPDAVAAKMGRMFGNMVSYDVDVPTWRDADVDGELWTPNTTLTLLAPDSMIYRETEMLIRKVTLRQDSANVSATLNVVLPGAFSGEVPTELPWLE